MISNPQSYCQREDSHSVFPLRKNGNRSQAKKPSWDDWALNEAIFLGDGAIAPLYTIFLENEGVFCAMRFQLKKTIDDWWCVVDNSTTHPVKPQQRLVVAASKDYEKMQQILNLLNENQSNFNYEYDEDIF